MRSHSDLFIDRIDTRKLISAAAIPVIFIGAFLLYYQFRISIPISIPPPLTGEILFHYEIHQLDIGIFLQLIIVPVLLLFLLANIPTFRRLLEDQTTPHATPAVLLCFLVVQGIAQSYDLWTFHSLNFPPYIGLLVILAGSLLGGWRIGLALGTFSLLFQSTNVILASPFLTDMQNLGVGPFLRAFDWRPFLYFNLFAPQISGGLWAAVFACWIADLAGPRRYSPFLASILGAILPFIVGYLQLAAGSLPGMIAVPAQAMVTGIAAAWVMLMVRTVQVESSRRKVADAVLATVQTELRALRSQINPHFFFNALNTIRYMIREDPQKARDLLIDLSELFQRTLRSGDFVPLRDELGYVEAYLSLEKARLGDRLRVTWGGALRPEKPLESDTPLLDIPVPTLALQPIVENAVLHGIGKKKEGGILSVSVHLQENDLVIVVADDGTGMDSDRRTALLQTETDIHNGIGLRNVDSRLRLLYGAGHGLQIESEPGRGTHVMIRIPTTQSKEKS